MDSSEPRVRRRDRHGRGLRGPLAPPQVPLALTRSEIFDDYVRESVERLERRFPELAEVEFAVQDVPAEPDRRTADAAEAAAFEEDPVPLARLHPGRPGQTARIVVYRRPVEIRARGRDERAALVHDVVVEQVAELLGRPPEDVDPRYGDGDDEDE